MDLDCFNSLDNRLSAAIHHVASLDDKCPHYLSYNVFVMFSSIQSILQHNCLLVINKPVVIGVSGGPDSLCLLDLLWRLEYPVIVAHLNHSLRAEADDEARKVGEEAGRRNLPFVTQKLDIRTYAEDTKVSIEEAARNARYKFLFEQARLFGAQAVGVGHNADDQVETVLMHLLRGTGLAGLEGMHYFALIREFDANIPLVRPLLGTWRKQISTYLVERHLSPTIDESNWDRQYFRNRLRHELLPELESYNPQIRGAIYRMSDLLQADQEIIDMVIVSAWDDCLLEQGRDFISLSASKLRSKMLGVQRHLLRRGIDLLRPGMRDFDYEVIGRGIAILHSSGKPRCDLAMGLYAVVEGDRYILAANNAVFSSNDWPQVMDGQEYILEDGVEIRLPEGWILSYKIVSDPENAYELASNNQNLLQAWLDADKLVQPVIVRGRRPGDRICPQGMNGHSMKVAELMINEKMPSRAREDWPLIISDGFVVWIPGYRLGHQVQLQMGVKHVAQLELRQSRLR